MIYFLTCIICFFKQKVSAFQDRVNKQWRKDGKDSLPWNMAVKFLMARKFDCQRALELYLNHEVRVN